jgi:fumarate reductase flavoprotein subunit
MIVDVLKKEVEKDNIEVRLNNKATEILKDKDGKVTGVEAVDKEGKEYTLDAKAVVLATGGFGANKEMVVKYQPGLKGFATTNQPGATGDGIVMAEKLGADFVDMKQIQTHPTVVPEKGILITEALRGNGAIMVNHEGKRFINELGTRDVLSKAILNQNGKTAYLIFNDGVRKSLKACEDYFTQGLVKEGATIEELAKNINVDPATLKATLDTYNGYVTDKKDKEFNKPVEVSLSNGKYYAIEITPAIHHTMGGVKINPKAEVIGKDGQPIKGLFAAGEVTGGVHGGNRLGGNAVADIVVFGRIAGNSAAEFIKSK